MTVRKKIIEAEEVPAVPPVFEEVIKVSDRIEQFTIKEVDRNIARIDKRIADLQEEKSVLQTRKTKAEAL